MLLKNRKLTHQQTINNKQLKRKNIGSFYKIIKRTAFNSSKTLTKLSDLEHSSFSLTAEFMVIDSENYLFKKLNKNIL